MATWRSGTWRPIPIKNQNIGVCNHKTKLLSGTTCTVSLKKKPVIQIYANVSEPLLPPPLMHNLFLKRNYLKQQRHSFR